MPAAHPKEFRDDVVAVARRGETPIGQVAKDFGISEWCLRNWLGKADVEAGICPSCRHPSTGHHGAGFHEHCWPRCNAAARQPLMPRPLWAAVMTYATGAAILAPQAFTDRRPTIRV